MKINQNQFTQIAVWLLSLLFPLCAYAHEGHDHAEPPAAVMPAAESPRVETATTDFELVAAREQGNLTLYVSDFASNAPLDKAQVEVELNGENRAARQTAPGIYTLALSQQVPPGPLALTVSVTAGERADLLALTLEAERADNNAAAASSAFMHRIEHVWPWLAGAAALVALGVLAMSWRRWKHRGRGALISVGMGLAAAFVLLSAPPQADAHEGHDHAADEAAAPVPMGSRPQRLPNGAVFMPKASQFQLGIRTQMNASAEWPLSVELAGHVQAEPSASAQVQAAQTGRIEPGPRGLPHVGMKVKRGEVLAWLVPVASSIERGSVAAASAELATSLSLAEKRLARLKELEGSVPAKEIEATVLEVEGLRQRKAALSGSLGRREALLAPVSGEIAEVKISIGQVLEARDAAFSIINRERLIIEALAYNAQIAGVRDAQAATLDGKPIAVSLLGVGAQLKEHALPVQFRVTQSQGLVVGQPVKVFAKLSDTTSGVKLPRAALVRGAAGEPAVWVKRAAEVFVMQPVAIEPLDGGHVIARDLPQGARVVTQGASLLSQVR